MSSTSKDVGKFHHSSNPSMQVNPNRPRLHTAGGIIKHGGLSRDKMMRYFGQTNRKIKQEICGPNLTSFPYSYRSCSQNRQVVNTNLQNNKRFFEMTHSSLNKTSLKENSNIQTIVRQLPTQFQCSFTNKIINDYKMQVGRIISHQKNKNNLNNNKKLIQNIKMQFICMPNDMTVRQKEIQKQKIQKMQEETEPTVDEQIRFQEELQRELKLNPIWKQNIQIQDILQKHEMRFEQQEKTLEEK